MKGMTIRQLAKLCGVGQSTIRRWADTASVKMAEISAKMAKARKTSRAALFTLEETIEIVRAGGNTTLADLLLENAQRNGQAGRLSRLPNGKQLEEMRRIYGSSEAVLRLDFILGFSRRERYLPPGESAAHVKQILDKLRGKEQPSLPGFQA